MWKDWLDAHVLEGAAVRIAPVTIAPVTIAPVTIAPVTIAPVTIAAITRRRLVLAAHDAALPAKYPLARTPPVIMASRSAATRHALEHHLI
jgi:hypothetical protein